MGRKWQRKTQRGTFTRDTMEAAIRSVHAGMKIRAAARQHSINHMTLSRYFKRLKDKQDLSQEQLTTNYFNRQVFTAEQENALCYFIKDRANLGYGLSSGDVRCLALELAVANNLNIPKGWNENKMAGKEWFMSFMRRHPDLSLRKTEGCSIARNICFNKTKMDDYFARLESVLRRNNSFADGSRVWNLDETATSTVQSQRKVVAPKGKRQVHQTKSQERGTSVSVCFINAHGSTMPPVMIFPRKKFVTRMLAGAYPGTLGLANANGYMTSETFLDVLEHFKRCTGSSKETPTLLILDSVVTHLSLAALEFARDNGITMLTFPPHTTHRSQPLDVGLFAPFKIEYDKAVNNWMVSHPAVPVSIYEIARFVNLAWSRSASPSNIINAFLKTGICPFNSSIFTDSDYAPSSVTFQVEPVICTNENGGQDCNVFDAEPEDAGNLGSNSESEDDVESSAQLDIVPSQNSISSALQPVAGQSNFVTPYQLKGLPKAGPKVQKRKPRQQGRSMVATDSPEKELVKQKSLEKEQKIKEKEERKRKREEKKENTGKQLKGKGKRVKVARALFENSVCMSDTENFTASDVSHKFMVNEKKFLPLKTNPSEGDYVLVQFSGKVKKYFVGKIISNIDANNDLDISYLRFDIDKQKFSLPPIPDLKSVNTSEIKIILPNPTAGWDSLFIL